ncbi:exonuclease domain-containing protein [Nonlabens ulvanivorans]|uniref:DNA polymerase III subunit epsilon n=1 Tax=Nonlabens ulvanivorans TaxID=906888 RepID=A0A084JX84_NONUL|nr:exonuclease domain-containing protein [Nonlabens ulvanivorans]KEZ93568.1 DNA polymerase III subunit epsilon [Nonlabens ulvanivorans]PRX14149.1 DNA polymerase-3 subunit epsilon [Nonlabens ulvanivorans]
MNHLENLYCVVDIETTGNRMSGNRMTEICIVRMRGDTILDKYSSLIDPEVLIPDYITTLTGIDNAMVANAPVFADVAEEILNFTKDCIFVAHNVNFDYNVLRNEFKRLHHDFKRKKLCTVRLSRELIPGMRSYSLGKLCDAIGIPLINRHRAEGDTDATVILFKKLLAIDDDGVTFDKFIKGTFKEGTFPPHLERSQFDELPETAGVYIFKDKGHKIIYIGKAINIRKRVLSHFYSKTSKSYLMCQEIFHIDHIVTGNELVALLQESDLIKKHYPQFNVVQKKPKPAYQILHYKNQLGIIQFAVGLVKSYDYSVVTHYNRAHAVEQLEQLCADYNLCPRYCSFKTKEDCTSHYKLKNCKGVCKKEELVSLYNLRAQQAIESLHNQNPNYIIKQPGRTHEESCFILVKDGEYQGYGYVDRYATINSLSDCEDFIDRKAANFHTNQIIRAYLKKYGEQNVIHEEIAAEL